MTDQHTYSFPKVSPADPHELRESLRAVRRRASDAAATTRREAEARAQDSGDTRH
ncbi:hypothetical protein [Patulibacter minatonensis]|uniref:hypothetical protein n=1 Tax=Patulibacter minatonensis TaxID=298163 RepID=UPI0012FB3A18|nr:hypothetical protein [Patulibacter minatonensis]